MGVGYFLDSYAVIEFLKSNPAYEKYFNSAGMLTYANLMEICYSVMEHGENAAEEVFQALWHLVVEPTAAEIFESVRFRKKHAKKRLSYADCLGYCMAQNRGFLFLTGDQQFKGMKNVIFVK